MKLFDVYPLFPIEPVKAQGAYVYDKYGTEYLDFYGGHAVISVGHSHPNYLQRIKNQLDKIAFYSNSVINNTQTELANKLGKLSGYQDYQLFLCSSGAEAVENALKMASFQNCKSKILAFEKAFHGRTSGALQVTDSSKIKSTFNGSITTEYLPLNDLEPVEQALEDGDVAGIIIEGIQGVAGIIEPSVEFLKGLRDLADKYGVVLILDEVQSGFGRTGDFFAHQHAGIKADIITMAKGMGNGFPIGGIILSPDFKASFGLLGTTFGGNHLACTACSSVLDIIEEEELLKNAKKQGSYLIQELSKINSIETITGRGLMLGIVVKGDGKSLRSTLLTKHNIFTGGCANPSILRLLPPMNITQVECDKLINAIKTELT
ncbi:MAG: aspartate aminotransferase family protein [Flavobacteriales bacterium]|nr:aspartate aminotransferase family protein [Flavobacteriales bacterium]